MHHVRYVRGQMPWEYDYADCETLCAGCHAREHGIIPPVSGWDLLFISDSGDLSVECEWCGTLIRHVHTVHHEKWEPMEIGCVCCDFLTGTSEASDQRRQRERRDRFAASPRWSVRNGRPFIRQGQMDVEVLRLARGAKLRIGGLVGSRIYASEADARLAAFDAIESGVARKALVTHGQV